MTFGLPSATLNAFASQAFIRKALKNPFHAASVLSFFFNVDYYSTDLSHVPSMQRGDPLKEMGAFWYAGSKEYDEVCRSFSDVVRAAGKRQVQGPEWHSNVDGKVAQMLLCDQLSRNCFRGTEEAFAYDETALDIARKLALELLESLSQNTAAAAAATDLSSPNPITVPSLEGEVYPPYILFVVLPHMHSESLDDHNLALRLLDTSMKVIPEHLMESFETQKQYLMDHTQVLERFGRYPHRNDKLGRKSDQAELAWLAKEDELPGWAKSQ